MGSKRVGSVFVGDLQRHRQLSSPSSQSTPPSSPQPPPSSGGSIAGGVFSSFPRSPLLSSVPPIMVPSISHDIDIDSDVSESLQNVNVSAENVGWVSKAPGEVDPVLALELRLRWLEALILGMKQDVGGKGKAREEYVGSIAASATSNLKPGENLMRLTETVQTKLASAIEENEGLKKFMDNYDQNSHLLTPSFALSGVLPDPPTYDKMTPEELDAFLTEMEPDVRAAHRDMLEIDTLEQKGVTGAGKLADYEKLDARLQALLKAQEADAKFAASLESRISSLVDRHATYVDTLSELFVAYDDVLTEAEDKLSQIERDRAERQRLGFS